MTKDCFISLKARGKKLDEGIKKLTDTWRYPENILYGYGTDEEEAEAALQILRSEITTLKENMVEDAGSRANHITEMNQFLAETQQTLNDLVQSINDIATVFSDYGYVGPEAENSINKMETECSRNSSLISSDVTDDLLEVEFTPHMTWRHKTKTNVSKE